MTVNICFWWHASAVQVRRTLCRSDARLWPGRRGGRGATIRMAPMPRPAVAGLAWMA
jgi:hypothetical protein